MKTETDTHSCSGCGGRIPLSAPNIFLADLLRGETRVLDEGERAEHELWQESVERYNTKRQAELVFAWVEYHEAAAERALANGRAIADRHRAQIEALLGPGHNGNGHREERNGHHGD